jgi:hypothetical protein
MEIVVRSRERAAVRGSAWRDLVSQRRLDAGPGDAGLRLRIPASGVRLVELVPEGRR